MLIFFALLALLLLIALPRMLFSSPLTRDVDRLGAMSDRWLAEHRSSRQP